MRRRGAWLVAVLAAGCLQAQARESRQVTIIYDAFGAPSALTKDWGFAALVEYDGKRVLFDTGNDAGIFEHNARILGIDFATLDAVVISHRHGDHTSGIDAVLRANPAVRIHVPHEAAYFGSVPPAGFLKRDPRLPPDLRYFEGRDPERWRSGTPWVGAEFAIVTASTEILPGFHVLTTRSARPGTLEMNELSLAVQTPQGLAIIVGCSHPGVDTIVQAASSIDRQIHTVLGGFHLVLATPAEIDRVAGTLADVLKVERVAPGHCTSEPGFSALRDRFAGRFDRAGLGSVIRLP